ncbi:inositol 2-dehydrogenase [Domibacillus sp. DTU_2020_1001157_1_SI_ALB_TIR_016]|uniref:inositol 2-dehydrogenase n=1 Tax=Domibacillus sp. DTU_2020_1001157_1_SI_ALB_TIR_016 TaxID=3077789 RepID=UPI0028E9A768|nr:inositol 2-dehydrogenase [Domibacillus sp. DTU_2020_1001157_1_SI_ALB_TIR_016]WNS78798.1 inositol 2-dehydrogenase [Domibacillus sp. DTU_2020_1001157_1_SI_ALB_TIR_016]
MNKKVRIGLIGAGRIGQLHGENLVRFVPNAELVAIADPFFNDTTYAWASSLGVENCYKSAEAIFANPSIDAVFICSATDTHADYIIQAAEAGKHIFCEKPIHYDVAVICEALAAVEKAGVKLQVGFVRRFDYNHKMVHDTVASGKLGAPHIVKVTSRDPEQPPMSYVEGSGGLFMDMMIHDFDMVRYLSRSEVTEVTAYGDVLIDDQFKNYDDVDTAIVMLKFANGALGVIDNSRRAGYGYDQRTEVHCAGGCVQVANVLDNTATISTPDSVICAKPQWFFLERYNQAFIAEAQAFATAILDDTETPVQGIDGLMPVLIAKAAKRSLDEGRSVKISEIEGYKSSSYVTL